MKALKSIFTTLESNPVCYYSRKAFRNRRKISLYTTLSSVVNIDFRASKLNKHENKIKGVEYIHYVGNTIKLSLNPKSPIGLFRNPVRFPIHCFGMGEKLKTSKALVPANTERRNVVEVSKFIFLVSTLYFDYYNPFR